ncbi:hypothetical protein LY76DRAFT_599671 [Colletotrichum caudatum]|nr:hypothetical protein LY76DRAFT_599671 [Colletotrichum caudatum]
MASFLHQSTPGLGDLTAQFFTYSFLDEDELNGRQQAIQTFTQHPQKGVHVDSSSTNPATPNDDCTAPDTLGAQMRHKGLWPGNGVAIEVTARVGVVAALAREVMEKAAENEWPVLISVEMDGSDETTFSARISPQYELAIQRITSLVRGRCQNTETGGEGTYIAVYL